MNLNRQLTLDEVKHMITTEKKVPPKDFWPDAVIDTNKGAFNGDLTKGLDFPMAEYARQVGRQFMFPISSSMLLMLGSLASVTCRCIDINPYGSKRRPLNAYVIVGAESGEGKTPVMEAYGDFINGMAKNIERKKEKQRNFINMKISDTFEEMKMVKKANPDTNMSTVPSYVSLKDELDELELELEKNGPVLWNMAESNLQHVAEVASNQYGYIPVRSDENESLLFLTGSKAGIETSICRKAFDASLFNYGKLGMSIQFEPCMSICIAGQRNIIDLLYRESMKEDNQSNGLMERFWFTVSAGSTGYKKDIMESQGYVPEADPKLAITWKNIIRNVMNIDLKIDDSTGDPIRKLLEFDEKGKKLILDMYLKYDELRREGGPFSQQPLTGFVAKSTAHIANLAGLFHILKHWGVDSRQVEPSMFVDYETIVEAVKFFGYMANGHKITLESKGIVGGHIRADNVLNVISNMVDRKKRYIFSSSEIQQAAGGLAYFRKGTSLTSKEMFDSIYPSLEERGICCVIGKKVYINPNFS